MLAAIAGAASAFFHPAISGIMPAVVSAERLQQANALRGLSEAAGSPGRRSRVCSWWESGPGGR